MTEQQRIQELEATVAQEAVDKAHDELLAGALSGHPGRLVKAANRYKVTIAAQKKVTQC